jgi:hypothetical protein
MKSAWRISHKQIRRKRKESLRCYSFFSFDAMFGDKRWMTNQMSTAKLKWTRAQPLT